MVLKLECQFDTNAPKQSAGWSGRFLIERFWRFRHGMARECVLPLPSRLFRLLYFSWGVLTLGKASLWLQGLKYSSLQEETLMWQLYSWSLEIFCLQNCFQCDVLRCDFGGLLCRGVRETVYTLLRRASRLFPITCTYEKSKILVLVAVTFWVGKRGHFKTGEQ